MRIPSVSLIQNRLKIIFPAGTEHRNYLIRELAAKTIFVCLYVGAVKGNNHYIRPNQVCRMTDIQAALDNNEAREEWYHASLKPKFTPQNTPWFADNTREPIRDETIGEGLLPVRAMIERHDLPTTSPMPRYCLEHEFANLFDPDLPEDQFNDLVIQWRNTHLSKAALSRQALVARGALKSTNSVQIEFPNKESRTLASGLSSDISKAVIEDFAIRFLKQPHVLWLSESGNKVVARDENLAESLGIVIDPSKALPDIILVDLGDDPGGTDLLVLFIEVVASDGPINRMRKEALSEIAKDAGFEEEHLAFLTAFNDRSITQFKKAISEIAWGSYIWFVSEPDHIIEMHDGNTKKLTALK